MAQGVGLALAFFTLGSGMGETPESLISEGQQLYEQNCVMCHYDGRDSQVAPPLVGSAMVNSEDPADLIRSIIFGLSNVSVVDGALFGGIMPPTIGLTDEEIVALTTYVRRQYGGTKKVTSASTVNAVIESAPASPAEE